jgi:tRNA (guanine37-N1)-methyltransferase
VILLTPRGERYTQIKAKELANEKHLIIVCGHYEGFDERIRTIADYEISIGDFVLTGGEIPAMVIADSVIRLKDGVITKESLENESFENDLFDYPTYTKPREYKGLKVPDVLLNGNHKEINEYRKMKQKEITEYINK